MTTTNDLLSPETISKIERLRGRDPDIDGLLRHAAALQAQLDALLRGEFICKKCGIRKDGESRKNEVPF